MSTKALLLLFLSAVLFSSTAYADQYLYVSLPQATNVLDVLSHNSEVHHFCAPCGDKVSRPMKIELLEIGRVWERHTANAYRSGSGESYWEVVINDDPVDLAYLYVRRKNKWENLALALGLAAQDVPRNLSKHQVGI